MPSTSTDKTRKTNSGSFKPGPDDRRHKFTRDECVAGFWAALESLTVKYDDDRARTFGKFLRREGRFSR